MIIGDLADHVLNKGIDTTPVSRKPKGKLLQFPMPEPAELVRLEDMVKAVILSNEQLVTVLELLWDLCTTVLDEEPAEDRERVLTEIMIALQSAEKVKELVDQNNQSF